MSTKTDNHNARAKLALRRHFLATWHRDPPDVLDCFAGYGVMWGELRREFQLAAYTPIEMRKIPGRLPMDSLRYLSAGGWSHNVIDLDAYGSPWKHFFAMLPQIKAASTVFLTIGSTGIGTIDRALFRAAGVAFEVPSGLHASLSDRLLSFGLAAPLRHGLRILDAKESPNPGGSARYFGLHLAPAP